MVEGSANSGGGFSREVPVSSGMETQSSGRRRTVGKVVYWLVVLGIMIPFAPFIMLAVVCTAGVGLIPLAALGYGVFKLYQWMFRE